MDSALEKLETMSFSREEREIYEGELKARLTAQEEMRTVEEKSLAVGEAKGLAKGLEEGKIRGRAEGLVEGRAEGLLAALERMIASGMTEGSARQILGME